VQTVDFFTPIVDDPKDWGRITAANALSDVYAMGGTPLTALQLLSWPRDVLPWSTAADVIDGAVEVLTEAACTLVGGHSIDDSDPKFGFAITGTVHPDRMITNSGARPGDHLILTKALGTGVIATGYQLVSVMDSESEGNRATIDSDHLCDRLDGGTDERRGQVVDGDPCADGSEISVQ